MQPVNRFAKAKKLVIAAVAVVGAAVVCAGGVALASGHARGAFMQHLLNQKIDGALDAVNATPAQRTAILAARDHVVSTMQANQGAHRAEMEQALTLWQADSFDASKFAAVRTAHQADAQKVGDAIVQALSDAHDALTSAQRQKLADYLRANKPQHAHANGHDHAGFMTKMVNHRVDKLLDQINASTDQRTKVHAAVDKALASVQQPGNHGADFDAAITLFTADTLDRAQVTALQAKHLAQMQSAGDAMVSALGDIHDVLDAGQRKQVADFIRAHHAGHGG
ncbi:MAG TPA: Spy/CpxP family protein refolding chaperone [Polyangia bacterium]|jgi:Spy/CpxP family protein refolding chaperone|nr:Spy/CpxP family protein refolding chaperone [Polyangia bacterium]